LIAALDREAFFFCDWSASSGFFPKLALAKGNDWGRAYAFRFENSSLPLFDAARPEGVAEKAGLTRKNTR
jgi:hypothetical protein